MRRSFRNVATLFVWLLMVALTDAHAADAPHLAQRGAAVQLVVDGKPFLMLAGELGNSTGSDIATLDSHWERLRALNLNTVLSPVYWELLEPQEGRFDFRHVDGLIAGARRNNMKVVLLWFGAWKNSQSSYVPAWVKRDSARFPRARRATGEPLELLTPFGAATLDADRKAFAALMAHLRLTDARDRTVLMVQVENEIGMIPEARDHSDLANTAFDAPVPEALLQALFARGDKLALPLRHLWQVQGARRSGSWRDVFGASAATDEIFMAWYFGRYVEHVASAGHAEYPLPMFVNAALARPGRAPGEYPSAGPLAQVFDVWKAAAPSIDFLAPDIYFPNFTEIARTYSFTDNPLFIPETGRQPLATPANAFYAIGAHGAIGFSPFAIEDYAADDPLGKAYALLDELSPLILQHQAAGSIYGVRSLVDYGGAVDATPQVLNGGGAYTLTVALIDPFTPQEAQKPEQHGGLILKLAEDEYLVAGTGLTVTFAVSDGRGKAGIESVTEGAYRNGVWVPGRRLNGDENHQGRHLRIPAGMFQIQRVKLYRY